ncbi:MAG: hypothetical protein LBV49_08865 [Azonexus sp.]|jgi:hypothetical protein|nr:hypothetical protein [Azonexus sp.]
MDTPDIAPSIMAVLFAWRFLLCLALASIFGFLVGNLLGPVVGFSILFFGVGFGLIWQGRTMTGIPLFASVPSPPLSKPVAFLGLALIGAVWGGFAGELLGSALAGAAILAAATCLLGAWLTVISKQHGLIGHLVFAGFSLLSGLGGIYALSLLSL